MVRVETVGSLTSIPSIPSTASHLRALLRRGRFEQADQDARAALSRIDELDGLAYRAVRGSLPWVWCAAGEVMWAIGDDRAAVPLLERARRDAQSGARPFALGDLACVFAVIGDLPRAEACLEQLEAAADAIRSGIVSSALRARCSAARGVIALSRLHLDEAADMAAGLAAETAGDEPWMTVGSAFRSAQLVLGAQPGRATGEGASIPGRERLAPALAAAVEAVALAEELSTGRLGAVMSRASDKGFERDHQHLCRPSYEAIALLAVGRPELAISRTDDCARGSVAHSPRTTVLLLAVRAAASQSMGRTESAVASLVRLDPLWAQVGAAEFSLLPARARLALLELGQARGLLPPPMVTRLADRGRSDLDGVAEAFGGLSAREWQILRTLGSASTLEEIAQRLFASRATIASHCQGIYAKLGVGSRVDAVAMAERAGVFEVLDGV